jgi:hypothetical protein
VAVFVKNLDAFIDSVKFYVDIRVAAIICGVIALAGAVLWFSSHQICAKAKGQNAVWGFVLGLLPVIGLLILLALPAPKALSTSGETVRSEPEPEADQAAPAASEGGEQGTQT